MALEDFEQGPIDVYRWEMVISPTDTFTNSGTLSLQSNWSTEPPSDDFTLQTPPARGVRNQVQAGLSMIHNLSGKKGNDLGGFRIEVTVRAATLRDATRYVNETSFLDPRYWVGVGPGPHMRTLLTARLIPPQSLLDNAYWVYQRAADAKVFEGNKNRRPSAFQLKALTDILNALGWNRGLRRPSKTLSLDAWWNGIKAVEDSGLLGRLTTLHQSDDIRALFSLARLSAGAVPCKAHPNKRAHRYQVNNTSPFRTRCCMPGCYHKLQRSATIYWRSC